MYKLQTLTDSFTKSANKRRMTSSSRPSFDYLYKYCGYGLTNLYKSRVQDLLEVQFTSEKMLCFTRLNRIIKDQAFDSIDDMKAFMVAKHDYYVYLIKSMDFTEVYGFVECLRCDTFTFSDNIFSFARIRHHIDEEHPFGTLIKSAHKS